jgi:hypothetical protein
MIIDIERFEGRKMALKNLLLPLLFLPVLYGESLQWKLNTNKDEIKRIMSQSKIVKIEAIAKKHEICRITQLLNIPGIGKKTVLRLSLIVGVRFCRSISSDKCYEAKIC